MAQRIALCARQKMALRSTIRSYTARALWRARSARTGSSGVGHESAGIVTAWRDVDIVWAQRT